jgi:hypothetical protein
MIIDMMDNGECKRFIYNCDSFDEYLKIIEGYMYTDKPIQVTWTSKVEHEEIFGKYSDEILEKANKIDQCLQ